MAHILVLNGGSSSLKAAVFRMNGPPPLAAQQPVWEAHADWGRDHSRASIRIRREGGREEQQSVPLNDPGDVFEPVLQSLDNRYEITAAGHRIVHGGRFRDTARIDDAIKDEIRRLVQYAPEHNSLELEGIEAAERHLGSGAAQVAVFDTAFHSTLPEAAATYPGPYGWLDQGIRRYGFHGISHQYVSRRAAEILQRDVREIRLITCHLGNGCSLAAVRNGESVDTTMGFTPLEGLMMGTRSGTIDPGIVIHLVRNCGYGADELDRILNKESGLKGLSGVSGDMRAVLEARERGEKRSALAWDVFVHRLCREVGGMLTSLGGVDVLVFTAGIGEHTPALREAVCARLDFLGVRIDPALNAGSPVDSDVALPESRVRLLVVHTDEEWAIARECYMVMHRND